MMAQSEGERRKMTRAAMQRSRRRQKINGHWQSRLGGDIDTARKKLAVDDMLAEEFLTQYDDYPWLDGNDRGSLFPQSSMPLALTDPELTVSEGWSLLLKVTRTDRTFTKTDIEAEAFVDKHTQDDIDAALVNGWGDMVTDACNAMAEVKRTLWRVGDPEVSNHDPKNCPSCGWKP